MDAETRNIFLRDIKRETININFLVQNILKLSKLDTNTVIFNSNTHTLEELINSSLKNISVISEINEVKVVTDIVKTTLKIDLKWQSEAISNVLKNSIEHSPKGSVIEVTTRDTSVFTEIKIRDHGSGIDASDLNHIFERFYKTKNSKSDSIGIVFKQDTSVNDKLVEYLSKDRNVTRKYTPRITSTIPMAKRVLPLLKKFRNRFHAEGLVPSSTFFSCACRFFFSLSLIADVSTPSPSYK